jgi:hypothetical protein
MNSISRRDAKKMVGKGWSKILDGLYDIKPRNVFVAQVKEKFGGLRFYIFGGDDEFHEAVRLAEKESYHVCEICGDPGKLREDLGWILTLCDKHYEQRKIERQKK